MRYPLRLNLIAIAALLAVCTFAVPAYADTQGVSGCTNCNGYTFQATLTPNGGSSYSLSYTITNVSGAPANAQSWSLTLFNSNDDIGSTFSNFTMSDGNTGAYQVLVGKSNNGNGDCNAALTNALCVKPSGTGTQSTLGVGQSLTFSFDFTCTNCTELAHWIFLSNGTCVTGSGNCYAISTEGSAVSVPEPSSPTLLVCTLLAALSALAIPRVRGLVFPPAQTGLLASKA
jgi:hypothetical protein